jgi:MFS family permease
LPPPEEATSYADFQRRLGAERAASILSSNSLSTRLRLVIGTLSFPIAFVFLLSILIAPSAARWWQWVIGIGLAVVVIGLVLRAMWRWAGRHRRREQLDRLTKEWRGRALKGEVPLSSAADPTQRWKEEAELRAQFDFERELDRAGASARPEPAISMMTLAMAGVVSVMAGAVCFFLAVLLAALDAPLGVRVALIIAMPSFAALGLIFMLLALLAARASSARLKDITARASAAFQERRTAG